MMIEVNGKTHTVPQIDIDQYVQNLACTESEAVTLYLTDKGIIVNDEQTALDSEAKGVKWREVKNPKPAQKRERKPNDDKQAIINLIASALDSFEPAVAVNVIKAEREITFSMGDVSYSVTLTAHRPPKT